MNNSIQLSLLLQEARLRVERDQDLLIRCSDGDTWTSRLLLSIMAKDYIRDELIKNEDSFLVLLQHTKNEVRQFLHDSFFGSGHVSESTVDKFDFIDFEMFKGQVTASSSGSGNDDHKENSQNNLIECSICRKVLSDKNNLKKHVDVVHFNIRNYNCLLDTCGKRFISRNDLNDHIRAVHEKKKDFICHTCGQALSTRHGLRIHMRIHIEGSKSITCSRCDKSFRHLSTYRKHIARVHDFVPENRLQCKLCHKFYNHQEGLRRHMRKFHDSKQRPAFKCDICSTSFVFNYDLNKHKKRLHSATKMSFSEEVPS